MLFLIAGTGAPQFHKGRKKSVKTPLTCMGTEEYTAISLCVYTVTAQMLPFALTCHFARDYIVG